MADLNPQEPSGFSNLACGNDQLEPALAIGPQHQVAGSKVERRSFLEPMHPHRGSGDRPLRLFLLNLTHQNQGQRR